MLALITNLILNIFVIYIGSKFIYLKFNKNKSSLDFFFTYNSAGLITFLLCFLLSNVKLDLGFALGLFAIFAILRFRTQTISVKEMTYFFITIGISAINALYNSANFLELIVTNFSILVILNLLELFIKNNSSKNENEST